MSFHGVSVKVLVVDDSAIIRQVLSRQLGLQDGIEVIGSAPDPFKARDMIVELNPDVLVLDIEMPKMDGITFLKKIMEYKPTPVIICSSFTQKGSERAIEAMAAGAVDVVEKTEAGTMVQELSKRIVTIGSQQLTAQIERSRNQQTKIYKKTDRIAVNVDNSVIGMGASTGGIQALQSILRKLPSHIPAIMIVQHLPAAFTTSFAKRLNELSPLTIVEARDGERVHAGTVYIAPGDQHMEVVKVADYLKVRLHEGEPVHHQRPAIDLLFASIAKAKGIKSCGVLLTGMGADGAAGMLDMHETGSHTIAQDESSSVVYGMPRVAFEKGAVDMVAHINDIPKAIMDWVKTLESAPINGPIQRGMN